jgi:hypothetical protein
MNPSLEIRVGSFDLNATQLKLVMPVLLAVFYFAAGTGTFQLGAKEFNMNRFLIRMLQSMFSQHQIIPVKIRYTDLAAEKIFNELRQKSENIQAQSDFNGFDSLKSQWKDYLDDETIFNKQIEYLKSIREELTKLLDRLQEDPSTYGQLEAVIQKVHQRASALRQTLTQKLQKFLVAFAFKNYRDDAQLERFLVNIHVLPPSNEERFQKPNVIARSLVMGFVFGLFFGPIFSHIKNGDALNYCLLGATALMGFTGIVTYGVQAGGWIRAVIWAGAGGYLMHLYWKVMAPLLNPNIANLQIDQTFWKEPILGLCLGILTACYLILLKKKINKIVRHDFIQYLISALVGAFVYPMVCMGLLSQPPGTEGIITTALVGAIAMLSMALSVNVGMRGPANVSNLVPAAG